MPRRNDDRPLRRRGPTRDPRPLILVVCEGRKTEPQYIQAFCRAFANNLVRVHVADGVGVPKTIVERAVARKRDAMEEADRKGDSYLAYDSVWCVFDVDDHPRIPDAVQQARDNDINLAVSNPCFELWLLLHFKDQSAHLGRRAAIGNLREHWKGYEKHIDFPLLAPSYPLAVERARALDERRRSAGDPGGNPSTGVYRLTEEIRRFGVRQ